MSDIWLRKIEKKVDDFARKHSHVYSISKKQLYASFEIGCFHAILNYYEKQNIKVIPQNLIDGEFRYLTSANGNPKNFSYVILSKHGDNKYQIRQNIRVKSHINPNIAFTPDIVVMKNDTDIHCEMDSDYAKGKRTFYSVDSADVVAAHECKSFPPFPELFVSFVGMLVTAHKWYSDNSWQDCLNSKSVHLAPTLFVGGCASNLHLKMIAGMENSLPINIVVGLHKGTWELYASNRKLNRLSARKIFKSAKGVKAA
jgi:hypothetical protein